MGAYQYLLELGKKKQSDLARYLLRLRTWEYRQMGRLVRVKRPTRIDKARRLGYKAKIGYSVFRIRIRRGDRRKKAAKGIVCGKPRNHVRTKLKIRISPGYHSTKEQNVAPG